MERSLKVFLLLVFSVLYTCFIGVNSRSSSELHSKRTDQVASQKQQVKSIGTSTFNCYTLPTEVSITTSTGFPVSLPKHPVKVFASFIYAIEKVFQHTFIQYHFYSQNGWLGYLRPALIFPFHYFW